MTLELTRVAPAVPLAEEPPSRAPEPTAPVTGAGWLAVGAVVSKASQTLVLLVFAAVLAPEAFGVITLAAVVLNVVTAVADLGTTTALVHFRGDAERAARTAVTLALATSLVLVGVVWFTSPWLARQLQVGSLGTDMLRGVVLCVPLAAVAGVSAELLRRALEFRRRVIPDIFGNALGAAVTVAALAWGQGAYSLVYGQLAQAFVVLLMFWSLRPPVRPGWSSRDASTLVSYGSSLAGGSLLTLIMLNVDYIVIAQRLGAHDVGVYSMAFRIAYMPYLLIAMVIGGAVFAHLCRMRGTAVGRATVDAAVLLHALVVPAYVAILVLAPQLQLLGDEWAPAVPALRWLAAYGLVLSALELLMVSLKSVGRTTDLLGLTALHLGILLVLLLLYVDRGVEAAAVVQLVAGVITLLAAGAVVARRVPGTNWAALTRRLLPVGGAAVACAGAALALQQALPWTQVSVVGLGLVGSCALVVYLVSLHYLDRHDHTGLAFGRRLGANAPTASTAQDPRPSTGGRASMRRLSGMVGLYGGLAVVALAAGGFSVVAPLYVLVALAAAAAVVAGAYRVEWVALAYVVAEPFGDLLQKEVHPDAIKALGAFLFVSWLLRLLQEPRTSGLNHPGVYAVGALVTVVLASFVAHGADPAIGLDHTVSYASYALVVVVLVDTVRRGRPDPHVFVRRLALAFVLSCTAAGAVAVLEFLAHGDRASGPLSDPNDLAFFMVAAVALALTLRRRSVVVTAAVAACAAVLVLATFATLSRGALLGLAAVGVSAVALGAIRVSRALAVGAVAAVAIATLWITHADVVGQSIADKQDVAATNVDLRVTTATMAAEMTADSPVLGQGPGGFAAARPGFVPADVADVQQTVAHQMYLDVSAELGLLGLAAFLAFLWYGVRGAFRARRSPDRRQVADGVLVGLAGTLVAACFLSEQFFLPIWLLGALGIALDLVPSPRAGGS